MPQVDRAQGPSHRSRPGRQGHRRARHQAAHARHHRPERKEHVRRPEPERAAEVPALRAHRQRLPPELPRRHDRSRRAARRASPTSTRCEAQAKRSRGKAPTRCASPKTRAAKSSSARRRSSSSSSRRRRCSRSRSSRSSVKGGLSSRDRLDDDHHRGVLVPVPLRHGRRDLLRLDGSGRRRRSSTSRASSTRSK